MVKAYQEQLELVQSAGADVILMASRALAASARSGQDYLDVYLHLLRQADRPVILHWLGTAFDAALADYWGAAEFEPAADLVARLAERADGKVAGVKLSVLDARREAALRRRLPPGVRLYTGDDFHYDELIRGDADGHSDALLGAFAAVTAPAAAALRALDTGDLAGYQAAIGPTMPLSRAPRPRSGSGSPSYSAEPTGLPSLNPFHPPMTAHVTRAGDRRMKRIQSLPSSSSRWYPFGVRACSTRYFQSAAGVISSSRYGTPASARRFFAISMSVTPICQVST